MILVIGAGQAGLAAGRELRMAGHDVLLLEAHPRLGESWRRRRESLRLFTPASLSALPGLPMPGADRYPGKDEVADYLRAYAAHFELPVRLGTTVSLLRTADGRTIAPWSVIWATGYRPDYRWLRVPGALAGGLPRHSEGISPVPGLAYLGLPFRRCRGSALLGWVGEDAAPVARGLEGRRRR
ncbi:NAD(P)-binding domain-containing protein [Streptosporangium sp. NPDC049376]|uniref:NAD(P)-binding domain-containing protein n=1 Tax=Streptosporangium sp. NPDC049376 TaxID=3366192 RepID=UPI00379C822D